MRSIPTAFTIALAGAALAAAQPPVAAPTEVKTLAATMNVYVFPADGQTAEVQNRQEAECYAWAVNNTKVDPFALQKKAEQQMQAAEQQKAAVAEKGKGAGAKGAVVGALRARRKTRRAQQEATQQIDQQTQQVRQATAEQIENFKKAFSVCLEAKKYMVKM